MRKRHERTRRVRKHGQKIEGRKQGEKALSNGMRMGIVTLLAVLETKINQLKMR
jgi:hypothetical protein